MSYTVQANYLTIKGMNIRNHIFSPYKRASVVNNEPLATL